MIDQSRAIGDLKKQLEAALAKAKETEDALKREQLAAQQKAGTEEEKIAKLQGELATLQGELATLKTKTKEEVAQLQRVATEKADAAEKALRELRTKVEGEKSAEMLTLREKLDKQIRTTQGLRDDRSYNLA